MWKLHIYIGLLIPGYYLLFLELNKHSFARSSGEGFVNLVRKGLCLKFVIATVTHKAPETSSSSTDILCLEHGLVVSRFCLMFAPHSALGPPLAVFSRENLTQVDFTSCFLIDVC